MENAKIQINVVIYSGENGDGVTLQRSMVLSDNPDKWLRETFREVKRILGSTNPGEGKNDTGALTGHGQEAQKPAPKVSAASSDAAPKSAPKAIYPNWRNDGVRGLLLLRCKSCKAVFHAFAKAPATEWHCNCGEEIPLSKDTLAWFEYTCESCKKRIYGRTNVTDAVIEAGSLNCICGADCPTMTWNPALKMYKADRSEA